MKNQHQELLQVADQCVKCGQCLSVCPTYNLFQNEAESPRGRISLIQGLLTGQLEASDTTTLLHLDHCLYCGNCETACPSGVNYIDLLDRSKQLHPCNDISRWQLDVLTSNRLFRPGKAASKLLPQGLKKYTPAIFQQALSLSMPSTQAIISKSRSSTPGRSRIGIFTGCVGRQVDSKAINLTIRLLEYCGFEILVPKDQSCCGAMYQHEGFLDKADQLLDNNHKVFIEHGVDQILYFASGCASQLKKGDFPMEISEATHFIASLEEVVKLRATIDQKIAIHKPCSLGNSSPEWHMMLQLIRAIAGDQLVELPDNHSCCGSAGLHLLKHPQTARQLLEPKLESLREMAPTLLLTANTGCALHFYNGIKDNALDIEVMHPAEWVSGLLLQDKAIID